VKTAALVGWSGNGELDDLHRTVARKLGLKRGAVERSAKALIVEKEDPVAVARKLAHLPGAEWIAVGYSFEGTVALTSSLRSLAKRYLRAGSGFRLAARVERSSQEEGDVLLEGNGTVLKSVKDSKVDERQPDVTFRIAMVADRGVVGAQLKKGPGGVPTSTRARVFCLVSGGYHSSVMAWMSVLSGYSVTLIHARTDDESLRQVGRLYAELSKRSDPGSLSLEVLDGEGSPGSRVQAWLATGPGPTMAGIHPECRGLKAAGKFASHSFVSLPIILLQEEEVTSKLESLGVRKKGIDEEAALSLGQGSSRYTVKRYGGKEADVNGVLDSILR
jgi:hypothetical protein